MDNQNVAQPPAVPAPDVPPRAIRGQNQGLQFIRAPPTLKLNMDLDTYLRRFEAYTNSIGAQPQELPHILINSMDDDVMQFIERHLAENITIDQLTRVLRQEMGVARINREDYKAKLRKTLRSRNEEVRSFYSKLWALAKRAYPDNEQVREANLRDAFVANFQDSQISARLRERADLTNEQMLDLAVTLLNCKNASVQRQTEVNASFTTLDDVQNYVPVSVNSAATTAPNHLQDNKLDQVINMLSSMDLRNGQNSNATQQPTHDLSSNTNSQTYQYNGDRRSIGLDRYPNNYNNQGNYNQRGYGRYYNNFRQNYRPNSYVRPQRRFGSQYRQNNNHYHQGNYAASRGFGRGGRFNNSGPRNTFYPRSGNF